MTGASRSSSNQARLVGPTGAPGASDPSGASRAHSRSAAPCDGSPIVSTTGSDARALAATRSTVPATSPVVPVESATAATNRSTVGRCGSSITARNASWTGASWSSRRAPSSDGTPRPARRSASLRQTPVESYSSRISQKTRVS